jgi:hypothetical protein
MTAELQFRLPSRSTVLAAAVVLVWGLGGCSLLGPKPSMQTPIDDPESVNIGYVLLYDLVAKQKNTDKLLIIKRVSSEVRALIEELSNAAGELNDELERFAKQDRLIKLDRRVLPLIEALQRENVQAERGKQFLETSGKEFERLLLLTQSGVLTMERHISRVMRDKELNPERKAFWEGAVKTFDRLYAKLVKLLEDQYFIK